MAVAETDEWLLCWMFSDNDGSRGVYVQQHFEEQSHDSNGEEAAASTLSVDSFVLRELVLS